jgi:RNA polymerase sigma-B factor
MPAQLVEAPWETRAAEARELLIQQHLPLVRTLARRFAGRGEQLDDLVQVGAIGLIKAVDRFDPARGDLVAYAVPTILGEIRRYLRDRASPVRVPRGEQQPGGATVVALPLTEELADDGGHGIEVGEQRALLGPGLQALSPRERRVVHLRYFVGLSQQRIAAELGLSQTHVSRLLRTSLEKLREQIGAVAP